MVAIRSLSLEAGIVTILLAASAARAEDYKGTFTLPIEVHWGLATLPPGDHALVVDTAKVPQLVAIRGEKTGAWATCNRGTEMAKSGESVLILIRVGNQGFVRQLRLVEAGVAFSYTPGLPKERLIAEGPELIQRIPVLVASAK